MRWSGSTACRWPPCCPPTGWAVRCLPGGSAASFGLALYGRINDDTQFRRILLGLLCLLAVNRVADPTLHLMLTTTTGGYAASIAISIAA